MTTFLYIDYGASPYIGRELRYSLATLLAEYAEGTARVIVYTDKADAYSGLHPAVTARDIAPDFAAWTRSGAYSHRIKPCVLIDALRREGGVCALVDTDSYVTPGFAATLDAAVAAGPAMDHIEARDPYPGISGFAATLPHARYVYDSANATMGNSGLIAARAPRDLAALEDAVALIDALWDAGHRLFKIEQIAVSEAFRLHGLPIGETRPAFQHYFRRSLKRYMHWRIDQWLGREPEFRPQRPSIGHPRNAVRLFNFINRLTRRY